MKKFKQRFSIVFLQTVIIFICLSVLSFLLYFPSIEGRAVNLNIFQIYSDPFILYIYAASIPFFIAFYQAFKILVYIKKEKVFLKISVKALRKIKYCAFIFAGFVFLAMPKIYLFGEEDDAPGVILMGLIIMFSSLVIATGTAVAQKLLQTSIDMKEENDLTV